MTGENTSDIFAHTEQLAKLIEAKHACLLQVKQLGEKQLLLADSGRISELLDLLAARHRLLLRLQQIDQKLAPYRSENPEERHWRSEQHRAACAEKMDQCRQMLEEILEQEKRCEAILKKRQQQTAERLQQLHQAHKVCGAYLASQQTASQPDGALGEA